MDLSERIDHIDSIHAGREMHALIERLFPICRSITGNGVRDTLRMVQEEIPIDIEEVPSGKKIFDWNVPPEWNINDAYIKNSEGNRVIDFQASNLHVVGYSVPIHTKMNLAELKPHLYCLPEHPDWVPYRTAYYSNSWGFCLSQRTMDTLKEDDLYEVCIDSTLDAGSLTYGEYYLPGSSQEEVLLSCHICHPSLCNDNLSGLVLTTFLAKHLQQCSLRHSFRILFIPGTIGSIAWLAINEQHVDCIKHGLVLTGVGDPGVITYKRSRKGTAEIDRIAEYVLAHSGDEFKVNDFSPYGYDERQYCSPGFDLPMGCFQRTPHGEYPEYHTSADNCSFVRPAYLADSLTKTLTILDIVDNNRRYRNTKPKCEPQLGKRGLYKAIGGHSGAQIDQMAMLWVLNLSDASHSLLDIAERSNIPFDVIKKIAAILLEKELLIEC